MTLYRRLAPLALAVFSMATWSSPGHTQTQTAASATRDTDISMLDAQMFYEVLVGELHARGTDPGTGYALILDAARRVNDARLYQRALEIALQSRSGDAALRAARAWKAAQPESKDANRYVLQILIALNRIPETIEPLQKELALTPLTAKAQLMSSIVPIFSRASDRAQTAAVVEQALADDLKTSATGAEAWTVVGRLRLLAGQPGKAIDAARQGLASRADAESPALLAVEAMDPKHPEAEALVKQFLDKRPSPEVRMAYARALLDALRQNEARQQLERITHDKPDLAEAWLILGALQAQDNQPQPAEASIQRYLDLTPSPTESDSASRALTQAYLVMAQLAEKRKDYAAAESWLARIGNHQDLIAAQARRASLMAAQGRVAEARELIRNTPHRTDAEARQKLMAEVQLLRDQKDYRAAYELLAQGIEQSPEDMDLLYDQALMADRLKDYDRMEKLLRDVIAAQPENQSAYNALGYSLAERGIRLDEARQLIRKALELAPGDPFITDSLGWVEFKAGNLTEAIRLLNQAFGIKPDAEIAAHLGEALWTQGQKAKARAIWRQGMQLAPDNETLQETLKRLQPGKL